MDNILIESFTIEDLDKIKNSLETDFDDFWNYNILKNELNNPSSVYLCCKYNSEIVGFAGISIVMDTAELNNIVIKKNMRGKGFSSIILKKLIEFAKTQGCTTFNLEVANNNKIAINLYKKFGFEHVGVRPNYYNHTDALLFTLKI